MPLNIVRQDITKMTVDAIVNAANTNLAMGGGVCGAIFRKAGILRMQTACKPLAPIQTGDAIVTPGFDLPATFVIHTAGPFYRTGGQDEAEQLRLCYLNSLQLAVDNKCESIAFPLISGGIYGYPIRQALSIAKRAIQDFLAEHELSVFLVLFDTKAFDIGETLFDEIKSYINEHYIEKQVAGRTEFETIETCRVQDDDALIFEGSLIHRPLVSNNESHLDDLIGDLDESFSETILRLIDTRGLTDPAFYNKANMDRKLFSKIRSQKYYQPSKRTAIMAAIALELSLDETNDLLKRAGYTLSKSNVFDVIIEFFITSGIYDVFEIDMALLQYDQTTLSSF